MSALERLVRRAFAAAIREVARQVESGEIVAVLEEAGKRKRRRKRR